MLSIIKKLLLGFFILILAAGLIYPNRNLISISHSLVHPQYNFIYAICHFSSCQYHPRYSVIDGKLAATTDGIDFSSDPESLASYGQDRDTRLYLHDTRTNISREISTLEAQKLRLSGRKQPVDDYPYTEVTPLALNREVLSPDGYSIIRIQNYGFQFNLFNLFVIGKRDFVYDYYISKGHTKKMMDVVNNLDGQEMKTIVDFVGWVIP